MEWMHARHIRVGIPGLQYPHLFTCLPHWDVIVCASKSQKHRQLTRFAPKFKDDLNATHVPFSPEHAEDSPMQGQHRLAHQVSQK